MRKRRLDLGLSTRDAAELIGVSPITLRGWENGSRSPAVRFLPAVICFLGYVPFDQGSTPGQQLLARRKALGLNRRQLAKRLGVDVSTVWRWESDRASPVPTLAAPEWLSEPPP